MCPCLRFGAEKQKEKKSCAYNTYTTNTRQMDDLASQFGGGLSLNAAEWKPAATARTAVGTTASTLDYAAAPSDLKATAVKEFVPGQGWSTAGTCQAYKAILIHGCLIVC